MESPLDILKLGFRGYRHLAEFSPPSVVGYFPLAHLAGGLDCIIFTAPSRTRRGSAFRQNRQYGSTMMIMR